MNSALYPQVRWRWSIPVLLGAWAAAVAVAPSLSLKLLLAVPAVLLPVSFWTLETPGRWIPCFFAAALLLPPLPFAWGDSGPHPSLWFAGLGLLAGLLGLPRWRVRVTGLNAALGTLLVVLLASVAPAAIDSGAAIAAASLARVGLLAIAVYIFFYTAQGPAPASPPFPAIRRLYWIAAASALFACIDFYFQFPAPAGYGPQFVWLDTAIVRRAQGVFYEASTLGNFCAFFLVMIAVCWSRPREQAPVSRKALLAGGAVFFTALVLSYSRASLVNVAVAGAVLGWRSRRRFSMVKLVLMAAACAAAGALLTWALFPALAEAYWLRLSASATYLFSSTEGVLSGRVASWRTLVDWMGAHPWQTLWGIGYKTLPYSDHLGAPLVADNMYLSLLVETGVAGLGALLWLNGAILRAAWRASRSTAIETSFCGTWMLCFWAGQTVQMLSGDLLTYWRVLPVYFWVLALAVRA
ncbi:MAG: O-antigen ligase family protein [Acidobacteriia bacterium]|nr:O-antigen ligase family protein [Terriglobia bacterium]